MYYKFTEIWRDIGGYEGCYQVSNLGRVKSLPRLQKTRYKRISKERILKQFSTGREKDYRSVKLCKDGKEKTIQVHRLVAQAFIPNPDNLPCVNHKRESEKWNNCIENLEWCTYEYNNNYGTHNERCAKNRDYFKKVKNTDYKSIGEKNRKKLSKKVFQYNKDKILVKIWESVKETKYFGFNNGTVSSCCLGKRKTHKGFIWSYERI